MTKSGSVEERSNWLRAMLVQSRHRLVRKAILLLLYTGGLALSFLLAYERRMDQLVTHPIFDYRISYRRILEVQARLLSRLRSA